MTLVTEKVVDSLREKTPITVLDWSAGAAPTVSYAGIGFLRAAKALATLIVHRRMRNARASTLPRTIKAGCL